MKHEKWLAAGLALLLACSSCGGALAAHGGARRAASSAVTDVAASDATATDDTTTDSAKKTAPKKKGKKAKDTDASAKPQKGKRKKSKSGKRSENTQDTQDTQDKQRKSKSKSKSGEQSGTTTGDNAANTLTEDASGASYESTADNQNAVLVNGGSVTLTDAAVNKTGDASGDSADFYGVNAAILAKGGAALTLKNAAIVTDGAHANGVFSYGEGTTVTVADSTITTSGSNSGGLMTTGGGKTVATNLTVSTAGRSSAAIRSDRGGGTVQVTGGSYTANGTGSPAVYSTADVTVTDATLVSNASEAVVIEGGNSVKLINVDATGNNAEKAGKSQIKNNVLIYQSASGDAADGEADFEMLGGKLTARTGAMFRVTNTAAEIKLSRVELVYAADSEDFLIVSADAWGTSGKNGGTVDLELSEQAVRGNIVVDELSALTLELEQNAAYSGAITGGGSVTVTLEAGSAWTLTGDSAVSALHGDLSGIDLNGHTLTVNGVAYVPGNS